MGMMVTRHRLAKEKAKAADEAKSKAASEASENDEKKQSGRKGK